MRIVGISGSLRKGSYNRALLRAAGAALPEGVILEPCEIAGVPLYDQDLDGEDKPAPVRALLAAIGAADALIIATPEYNYGIPGGLKNAIDWASRPAFKSVLAHRPTGLMSAARSPTGGARAQSQIKQVLAGTLTPVYPAPELLVPMAQDAFDASGTLIDEAVREKLERYVREFVAWAGRMRPA